MIPVLLAPAACVHPEPSDPEPLVASGAPSAHVPSVLRVAFEGAGEGFVEYGEGGFDLRTPGSDGPSHDVAVLGLAARRSYQWRAVLEQDGVRRESAPATFTVPAPPPELLDGALVLDDPEAEAPYVLGSVIRPDIVSFAAILDREGEWVWWAEAGPDRVIITPELSPDGAAVTWTEYDFAKWEDVGTLVRVALDGSSRTETRLRLGHHDVVQHDDGTVAFLAMEFRELTVEGLGTVTVGTDTIEVGPEGMTDADPTERRFSMLDDFPYGMEVTCSHMTTAEGKYGVPDVYEWTHANSMMYVAEEDAYYLNDKFTDWFKKVDRSTGELLWVMNGLRSDFTTPAGGPVWGSAEETTLWSHSHLSQVWAGGAMVFDNGDHHDPPRSRAIEVAWDEGARTAEVVWVFDHPDGGHTPALGDVRRLPSGHVLVTWSQLGELQEITADRRVVWEVRMPPDQLIGRIVQIPDLYHP